MGYNHDPDLSQAFFQGNFGTKEMAKAYAADIEKVAGLQSDSIPRLTVEPQRDGTWTVWSWEY